MTASKLLKALLVIGMCLTMAVACTSREERFDEQVMPTFTSAGEALKKAQGKECAARIKEAAEILDRDDKKIGKIMGGYKDFPNASEQSKIDGALNPGVDAAIKCIGELTGEEKTAAQEALDDFNKQREDIRKKVAKETKKQEKERKKRQEKSKDKAKEKSKDKDKDK